MNKRKILMLFPVILVVLLLTSCFGLIPPSSKYITFEAGDGYFDYYDDKYRYADTDGFTKDHIPEPPIGPDGKMFDYWSLEDKNEPYDFSQVNNKKYITLIAVYRNPRVYTIEYDFGEGTKPVNFETTQSHFEQSSLEITAEATAPAGKDFYG